MIRSNSVEVPKESGQAWVVDVACLTSIVLFKTGRVKTILSIERLNRLLDLGHLGADRQFIRRFQCSPNCRQQQAHKDADDRDHDQQLNEGESGTFQIRSSEVGGRSIHD